MLNESVDLGTIPGATLNVKRINSQESHLLLFGETSGDEVRINSNQLRVASDKCVINYNGLGTDIYFKDQNNDNNFCMGYLTDGQFNFQNEQVDKSIQIHQQGSGTIKNLINSNVKTTLSDTELFVDVDLKIKDNLTSDTALNLNALTTTINNFIEVGSDTMKFLTNTGTPEINIFDKTTLDVELNDDFRIKNLVDSKNTIIEQIGLGEIKNVVNSNTKTTLSDTQYFVNTDLKIKDNINCDSNINLNSTATINNFVEVNNNELKFLSNSGTQEININDLTKIGTDLTGLFKIKNITDGVNTVIEQVGAGQIRNVVDGIARTILSDTELVVDNILRVKDEIKTNQNVLNINSVTDVDINEFLCVQSDKAIIDYAATGSALVFRNTADSTQGKIGFLPSDIFQFNNDTVDASINIDQAGVNGSIKNIINNNVRTTLDDTKFQIAHDLQYNQSFFSGYSNNSYTVSVNNVGTLYQPSIAYLSDYNNDFTTNVNEIKYNGSRARIFKITVNGSISMDEKKQNYFLGFTCDSDDIGVTQSAFAAPMLVFGDKANEEYPFSSTVMREFNPGTTLILNVFRLGDIASDATISYINISITELSNF